MSDISNSRLYVPQLGGVYRAAAPYTELLIRVVAGLWLIPHGYPKLLNPARSAQFLAREGFEPGMLWAILIGLTEVVGGLMLALGLFTRLACVPIFIFLVTAAIYHSKWGFLWNARGLEYPLFWAIVVFHFMMNGAGRYSVDAKLRKEI